MVPFLWGVSAMGCWVAGLFFLRFWRDTRDRLFGLFAAAFWVLGASWLTLAYAQPTDDTRHYAYLIRLLAFLLIAIAIVDKNRGTRRQN